MTPPAYGAVEDRVEQYFCIVFTRPIGGNIRWCGHWRDDAATVLRLEALWGARETLRLDSIFSSWRHGWPAF